MKPRSMDFNWLPVWLVVWQLCAMVAVTRSQKVTVAKPSGTQRKWLDYELGAVIHFNMQTFDRQMKVGHVAPPDTFNPTELSTDQWLETAKSFGAKYVVLTLGHFSGFLLWPSKTYNYTVGSTNWREGKADIAAEFVASCKKHGLEYGFFLSVHNNWFMGVDNYLAVPPFKQSQFNRVAEAQMKELFGRGSPYGNPFYIWLDAGIKQGISPDIGPILRSLAPNSICDECPTFAGDQGVRWVGNENAQAPLPNWYPVPDGMCNEHTNKGKIVPGTPLGRQFCPASCDTVLREHYWFWIPGTAHTIKDTRELVQEYLTSVGRGCTMILNMGPDESGLVPRPDVEAYRKLGSAIRSLNSAVLLSVDKPEVEVGKRSTWRLDKPFRVNNGSFVLMEDVSEFGQLVAGYRVSFRTQKNSKCYSVEGTTIGHKRIVPFPRQLKDKTLVAVAVEIKELVTGDAGVRLSSVKVFDWSDAVQRKFI